MARRSTVLGTVPVMMKPPMPTLSPVCTRIRVERLIALVVGVALGLAVGLGTIVAVGLGAIVADGLGVGVGMIVAVGLGLGGTVAVGLTLAVAVGVAVGTMVAGGLAVAVGLGVGVPPTQLPLTLKTRCMFGNPIPAVVVGVVIPHPVALR